MFPHIETSEPLLFRYVLRVSTTILGGPVQEAA